MCLYIHRLTISPSDAKLELNVALCFTSLAYLSRGLLSSSLKVRPHVIKVIIHLLNKTNLQKLLPGAVLSARQRSCSASLRQIIVSSDNCRFHPNAVGAQSSPNDCARLHYNFLRTNRCLCMEADSF